MSGRTFDVIVERDADGWYVAEVPALRGCRTQAQTMEDLRVRVREAIVVCLEDEGRDGSAETSFVGIERVTT